MQSGSRYEITREPFDGLTSFVLREPATGSAARVVPDLGNNVVSFRTTVGATVRDILMPPPSLATLREQPLWYGVPVMFPFPGRVRGARFSFAGREVELVPSDGQGNALHGVAFHRAWTVVEATADDGAALCSRIDTNTHPDILREWPFAFRLTVGVRLKASALTLELAVENTGPGAMPMGLGLHPYFATPLGSGTRDECLVSVSAERHWEQKMALPTGVVKPVAESIDPRRPRTIGSLPSEHYPGMGMMHNLLYSAFGRARGLPSDADGGIGCTIRDAAQSVEVRMECSASFGALVLFTPPWNSSLSLEPHTCVPDAFNLANQGLETGMVVLSPGGTWRGWVRMSAREL